MYVGDKVMYIGDKVIAGM